jgi:AcrR family transcriptional regulator
VTNVAVPPTSERLLEAAIRLFARQGYAQTSVADIQRACGLRPGSGALYRHFSSKRELLETAIARYVERLDEDRKRFDMKPGDSTEQVLRRAATLIWDGIDDNAMLLRVVFSEPSFPKLAADELWSAITENAYGRFATTLRAATEAGVLQLADPEATAAVLVASLAYYPMVRLLIGHTPGEINRDRYLEAWVSHAHALVRLTVRAPGESP